MARLICSSVFKHAHRLGQLTEIIQKDFNKTGIIYVDCKSSLFRKPPQCLKKRRNKADSKRWRQTQRRASEITLTHLPRMNIGKILWEHVLDRYSSPLTYIQYVSDWNRSAEVAWTNPLSLRKKGFFFWFTPGFNQQHSLLSLLDLLSFNLYRVAAVNVLLTGHRERKAWLWPLYNLRAALC